MGSGPLILGATGNVGQALQRVPADCWSDAPIWQSRTPISGYYHWDILNCDAPDVVCSGIVMLAGTADSPADVHIGLAQKLSLIHI